MSANERLKVMTVVGTRPEVIRLSRVIPKLDYAFDHLLIHTGQNYDYELNNIFFAQMRLRVPDKILDTAGKNSAETIAQVISKTDEVFEKYKPDALLLLGDTNSVLCSIAAKRRKIPIFHMEAGNRCFDFRVPEETNRRIVDHISDINMPYSSIAREYLLREGFPPDQIIKTGSPMREVLDFYAPEIAKSTILKDLGLQKKNYFLISAHREENVDSHDGIKMLVKLLNRVALQYQVPVILSTHPRTRKRLEFYDARLDSNVKLMKPFGFFDYITLQKNAICVLSDSGTITEESSLLNFPALNIRQAQERPEGFEEGAVMMVGMNPERVIQGLNILKIQVEKGHLEKRIVEDYLPSNVSDKVVNIIQSYVDFINQRTWKQ